jgi:hypothetical protein
MLGAEWPKRLYAIKNIANERDLKEANGAMAEELISFKGKLIYEISKEAYIKIRKRDLINLYFNLILFTIVLLLALYLLYKFSTSIELLAISILIIIVICFAPLLIGSTLGRYFKTARLKKFRICGVGFFGFGFFLET